MIWPSGGSTLSEGFNLLRLCTRYIIMQLSIAKIERKKEVDFKNINNEDLLYCTCYRLGDANEVPSGRIFSEAFT